MFSRNRKPFVTVLLLNVCASGLTLLGSLPVSAQTILNPSFETPDLGGGYQYQPAGASWNFSQWTGIVGKSSPWGSPIAPEGVQMAILQSFEGTNPEISQGVSGFSVNQQYEFSFAASQRPGLFQNQDFEFRVDDILLGTFQPKGASFEYFTTAPFAATATTHTLRFIGLNSAGYTVNDTGDNTALLDDVRVRVVTAAVPEPGTLALLSGVAIPGAAFILRRRRARKA